MLLHRRERAALKRRLEEFPVCYTRLTYEHKREIVGEVAKSMVAQELSALPRDAVMPIVQTGLSRLDESWSKDTSEFLDVLMMRSGVLRLSGRNEITFIHNTIREYLAAPKLVAEGYLETFLKKAEDPTWQPVIVFACALAGREFTDKVIADLLGSGPDERGRHFLAIRCAEAALGAGGLAPALQRKVQKARASLFPPQKMKEAEALAALGDAAIRYLRPSRTLRAAEAAACIRTLRLIGTEPALAALDAFAGDTRAKVRTELIRAPNGERFLTAEIVQRIEDFIFGTEERPPEALSALTDVSFVFDGKELDQIERVRLLGLKSIDVTLLANLTALKSLSLRDTAVADLGPLAGLTALRSLDLMGTRVADLGPLAGLAALRSLDLVGTPVADLSPVAGLAELVIRGRQRG